MWGCPLAFSDWNTVSVVVPRAACRSLNVGYSDSRTVTKRSPTLDLKNAWGVTGHLVAMAVSLARLRPRRAFLPPAEKCTFRPVFVATMELAHSYLLRQNGSRCRDRRLGSLGSYQIGDCDDS
jgi:hypothetical protein